jgi:uncharacterized membrane protein
VVGGVGIYQSPSYYRLSRPERVQAFREMSRLIPPDASLVAQQNIYPHFDGRQTIQIFSIRTAMPYLQTRVLENPDYVACDRVGNSSPFSSAVITADIADMEKNPGYEKIYERENFLLFKRRADESPRWRPAKEEYGL